MSTAIVAVIALCLCSAVKVRVDGAPRRPERRGTLTMLDSDSSAAKAIRLMAMEAGPFPSRSRPSEDPAVQQLLNHAVSGWLPAGTSYQASWRDVPLPQDVSGERRAVAAVLPPLPELEASVRPEKAVRRVLRPASLTAGIEISVEIPPPVHLGEGAKFLVNYDRAGFVVRATCLDATPNAQAENWLMGGRIKGGNSSGGWLAVEIQP